VKTLELDGKRVKLQIWETSGDERFREITEGYYRAAQGIILFYNINEKESFEAIPKWYCAAVERVHPRVIPFVLVGTRTRVNPDTYPSVTPAQAQQLAADLQIPWFEVNTQTGENVHEPFTTLVRACLQQAEERAAAAAAVGAGSPSRGTGGCRLM